MTSLEALITNIELCSKVDGCSTVTFPTLKKLSVNDVVTIWSSVSKHVRQQLLQTKPHAVSITGLGTFHIQKWLSFENGEVLTFQRPRFSLSGTVARIRELRRASVPVPGEMKKVSVSYKKIHSDVPYSKEVVQNCMQETLNFFYFILTNRGDVDFVLEDVGTLAIRGKEVTMAFCQDFLLSLNKSTCVVEKLLTKKWVISDKEVALAPSSFGRVYRFPQFEMRAVPRRASLADQEILAEFESALSSMGIRAAVRHTLLRLRRGLPPNRLGRAGMEEEAEEETEGTGPQAHLLDFLGGASERYSSGYPCLCGGEESWVKRARSAAEAGEQREHRLEKELFLHSSPLTPVCIFRLLPQCAGTEGRQHKETPFESPELPSPTSEERRQTGEVRDMDGRLLRHLIVDLPCKSRRHVIFAPPVARPASPFLKPTRATDLCHLSALQLPQEEEDGLSSLETTCGTEEGLQTAEAWSQARRQFRRELESLGDIEKWLAHKPSLSSQEERCWERIKARRAERTAAVQSAVTDSPENKDSPIEWKEKCRLVRSGDGPVDEHCLPSTVEADLGELVDRYRRNAVVSYLKSSELCQELSVAITNPTLQKGIFRGIRCKSQATITSGLVTSWTSYAFTFLKSGMTGPTPCSAMFIRPSPPTVASKAPTAASSSASRDTWPWRETLPSRRPTPPEALLQAAGDVCTALRSLGQLRGSGPRFWIK
ncbi:LOW QUALITY PROTEIN: uncharacterized protein LJ206_000077 [Theristicus caerulescens]